MQPVTLLLPPPSRHSSYSPSSGAAAFSTAASQPFQRVNIVHHSFIQASGYLAQHIAQEYLQSGLTVEPHEAATSAYRRFVPPVPSVDILA